MPLKCEYCKNNLLASYVKFEHGRIKITGNCWNCNKPFNIEIGLRKPQ